MVRYDDSLVEEIRNSNDIADIISQYVVLKRSGRNFLGLCPFHKEKTPSFSVSTDKQIFHCFGCGVGGDVIAFVSKIENITYKEAIELLAEKAQINLPISENKNEAKNNILKNKIYEINEEVAKYYHHNLYNKEAVIAQEYVKRRALNNKTLQDFQIGFAENKNEIYKYLKEKGFNDEEILASNLVRKMNNSYVDTFRNRLMFPIQDVRNRVIAFGGRVLDNSLPKYINSPDSLVYSKRKNLYALNFAKQNNPQEIIMVEGYMDTVSLHQRGITNVVASLGTSLTDSQGRLLRKYSPKVIISYDSDGAGQNATLRGLDILANMGCDIRVLQMEGAKDPDEFITKYGTGKFSKLVQDAISLTEFKVKVLKKELDITNVNDKIKFLKETAKLLTAIDSKIEQEIYIEKIAKEYQISKEAIYAEINKISNKAHREDTKMQTNTAIELRARPTNTNLEERENSIISLLMNGTNETYNQIKEEIPLQLISSDINQKIIKQIYENPNITLDFLLNVFQEQEEVINRLTQIMAEQNEVNNIEKAVKNIINTYKKEKLGIKKLEIVEKLKNENNISKINELESELQETLQQLKQLK